MSHQLSVSVIMATRSRPLFVERTLKSIFDQSHIPAQVIVVDGSSDRQTEDVVIRLNKFLPVWVEWEKAEHLGAAVQRVQGLKLAKHAIIWFVDDDIVLDPECTIRLWSCFSMKSNVGAVSAMLTNQCYTKPGLFTMALLLIMHGKWEKSYAGKLIGPAWNLLPEDDVKLPDYVACDWLNTTCTMYFQEALPQPVFDSFFKDYSMMEDVALSATIAKKYDLFNARTARVFHDSQPGIHKDNIFRLSRMALVNRYWVMTRVLHRQGPGYICKLALFETVGLLTTLRSLKGWRSFPAALVGKINGWVIIACCGKSL